MVHGLNLANRFSAELDQRFCSVLFSFVLFLIHMRQWISHLVSNIQSHSFHEKILVSTCVFQSRWNRQTHLFTTSGGLDSASDARQGSSTSHRLTQ